MNDRSVKIRLEIEKVYKELSGKGLFDKDIKSYDQFEGVVLNAAKKISSTTDATLQQIKGVLNTFMTSYKNLSEVRIVDKNDPLQRGNYVDSLKKNFNANTIRETIQRWIEDYLSELYKLDFKPKDKKRQRRKDEAYAYDEAQIEKFSVLSKDLNTYIVDETVLRNRLKTAIDSKRQEWDDYTKQKNTNKGLGIEESRALLEKKGKEFNGIKLSALTNNFFGESINKLKNLFSGVISDVKKDSNKSTPETESVNSHRGLLSRAIEIRNQAKNIGDVNNVTGKITSELSNGSSSAELNSTLNNTAEELKESAKNTSQAAEGLRDLAKATDTASANIGDLSDAQKNAAKKEKIKQKKIASLNERYDLGIDAKATPENLHKLLQGQLFDLSYEMAGITEKYGKHRDKWSDKIAAKYDSLKFMSDDIRMADSSVSRAQSSSTYAAHEDAMQVAMYSSAYQRLYGKADKRSMTEIQKGFVNQTLSEISQLDLKNPINDGLKKLIPNVLENVNMTGFSLRGTAKQNSVFWEFAKNTKAFKEYSETLKLSEPNITDKEIKKRFMKDKMQRAKATGDIIKGDQQNGTNNMALITKAGSGLFLAANIGVKAIESLSKVIIKLGEESVVAFEDIQALQTQLGVVFSSQGEASNMFQKFADYAVVSPFGVNTMVQQGIQLKQSGVGGSELLDTMKRIGDISSGNQEKMKSISDVYSRVMASTTVTARDMRQLVNAGVPAYDALTKAMQENPNGRNISRSNVRSLLQSGKVTSEDFQLMLKNLTDEGGMFYGATKVGAKTLKARKQNLSDIRELAFASIGERIATGGRDLESTFYGKLLGFQENMWGAIKSWNEGKLVVKTVAFQKKKLDNYKAYTEILEREDLPENLKKFIANARGDYNYADYITAASNVYEKRKDNRNIVSDDVYRQIVFAKNRTKERDDQLATGSEIGFEWFENLKKNNPFIGMSYEDLKRLKKESVPESKYKDTGLYKTENNVIKFSEALTRGSDAVENFIKATDGATSLVAKEKQRYDSTSVGSLIKSDEEYLKKAEKKNKMNEFTRIRENDKWVNAIFKRQGDDLTSDDIQLRADGAKYGLTLDKYSEMVKYMAAEQKAMDLTPDAMFKKDVWGNITNEIAEGAQKSWDTLYTNIRNLDRMIEDDDMDKAVKEGLHVYLRDMLATAGGALKKESLETMSNYRKDLEDSVSDIKDVKLRNKIEEALNYTFTDITYDNKRQEAINKSGNPHLWAEALSKLTGIASNRIQLEGQSKVFDKYQKYLAPKNLSKSLITSMMAANTMTFKEAAVIMNGNKTGYDSRGNTLYDWEKISKQLSKDAKDSQSAEVRNSYVSSLQEQINALNELTVGSLSLGETAEEVRAGLTNMGVAFDYSLEKGSNGLIRFSNSTLEAADAMKRILEAEMGFAKINNIKKDFVDSYREEARAEAISGAIAKELGKNINPEELRTVEGQKTLINKLSDPMRKIADIITKDNVTNTLYKTEKSKDVVEGKYYSNQMPFMAYLKRGLNKPEKDRSKDEKADLERAVNFERELNKIPEQSFADEIRNMRDLKAFTMAYIPGVSGRFKNGLVESFKRYTTTGTDYKDYTKYIGDPTFDSALKNLKSKNGNSLYSAAQDTTYGPQYIKEALDDYILNISSLTDAEYENLKTVLEKFGFSIEEITKDTQNYSKIQKKTIKKNNNTIGWTAFLANFGTKNKNIDGLNGVDIDQATGEYKTIVKHIDVAKKYLDEYAYRFKDIFPEIEKYSTAMTMSEIESIFTGSKVRPQDVGIGESILRDINNQYLLERRLQGAELGDYKKSPFFVSDWEKEVNKNVYHLDEYTSFQGRNDFIKNNLLGNIVKGNVSDILGDNLLKNLSGGMVEIISKAKSNEFGGKIDPEKKKLLSGFAKDFMALSSDEQKTQLTILKDILSDMDETSLSKLANELRKVGDAAGATGDIIKGKVIDKIKEDMGKAFKQTALDGLSTTMKSIGKSAGDAFINAKSFSDVWKNAASAMRGVLSGLADQTSQLLMNAGLSLISQDPKKNMGMGLALIAASGLGSFISGMLSATEDNDNSRDDEYERLQKLKDNMAELLQQARNDAEYYEKELKNKKAISTNMTYSTTKVNDMILTPQGQFSTAPDDFIFAMKHPEDLSKGSAPVINFNVVNNSSTVETRTEQRRNSDGSFDFVTVIDDVVSRGIAQGRYNDAFNVMQAGQNGTQTYA